MTQMAVTSMRTSSVTNKMTLSPGKISTRIMSPLRVRLSFIESALVQSVVIVDDCLQLPYPMAAPNRPPVVDAASCRHLFPAKRGEGACQTAACSDSSVFSSQRIRFAAQGGGPFFIIGHFRDHRQFLHGFEAAIKTFPRNFTQTFNSSLKMRPGGLDLARCKLGLTKTQKHQAVKNMIFRKCVAPFKSVLVQRQRLVEDRKSTRLNSSHVAISY